MKNLIPLILLCFLSCEKSGRVTNVKDGDTIEVTTVTGTKTLRLAEIDCPEKNQPYGQAAKRLSQQLMQGKITYRVTGTDRYGREIAKVYAGDKYVSEELVKQGYAWVYRRYSGNQKLIRLEGNAKSKRIGLWADPNPQNPSEFRRRNN